MANIAPKNSNPLATAPRTLQEMEESVSRLALVLNSIGVSSDFTITQSQSLGYKEKLALREQDFKDLLFLLDKTIRANPDVVPSKDSTLETLETLEDIKRQISFQDKTGFSFDVVGRGGFKDWNGNPRVVVRPGESIGATEAAIPNLPASPSRRNPQNPEVSKGGPDGPRTPKI